MIELSLDDITAARQRIEGTALHTPLVPSPFLTSRLGQDVLLKLELAQPIGAFKLRGATNAIFSLPESVAGVTCSSTGNHGRAVAYAARARGLRAVVCMSELVPATKVDGIRALGAEVRIIGQTQDEAQLECDRLVLSDALIDISPFDDLKVIAGQGTIGLELLQDRPDLAAVLVPLSGGGLAGGIGFAIKATHPNVRMIGVTMDRGPAMYLSIPAGHPVEVAELPSLADSLGGGIGVENHHSLALCQKYLDDTLLVSEEEIYHAMQAIYYEDRLVCEGGSAVGVAALLSGKLPRIDGPVAVVITGRNVDMHRHAAIMQGEDIQLGTKTIKGETYGA